MSAVTRVIQPKDMLSRVLYLFHFRRHSIGPARKALQALTAPDRKGTPHTVWQPYCLEKAHTGHDGERPHQPHHLYREELLSNVVDFTFGRNEPREPYKGGGVCKEGTGCSYLRISDICVSRWFNKLEVLLRKGQSIPVRLESPAQVELFLSSFGVGVLSFAFTPEIEQLDRETALAFNYRLSQLRRTTAPELRIATRPARAIVAASGVPPDALPESVAVGERFGINEASTTLRSLIEEELLRPLVELDFQRAQEQLSVYTVVRFGSEVDFESRNTRARLAPFLSSLTQVEEPSHAGATSDLLSVPNTILNRRHWAATSTIGSAHLVADQEPPDHPFNAQRVPRLLMKYFVPYNVALLQRMALQRVVQDACELVRVGRDEGKSIAELRGELIRFAVNGHFTEVSNRAAIQQYYRLSQDGLGVRHFLEDARRALSEMEAKQTTDTQLRLGEETKKLQERITEHLGVVKRLQIKVEWIEILIVGIYFSELAHTILAYVHDKTIESGEKLVSISIVVGVGLVAAVVMLLLLKPWEHAGSHE